MIAVLLTPFTRRPSHRLLRWLVAGVGFVALLASLIAITGAAAGSSSGARQGAPRTVPGIPQVILDAYVHAAAAARDLAPSCVGMRWQILAGIGAIESDHADGHTISRTGDVTPPILGPRLDGRGNTRRILDTDDGRWDKDTRFDRATGPMQFLPGTWGTGEDQDRIGRDGNGDGRADPHNAFDAAHAAVVHLCGPGNRHLGQQEDLKQALFEYNRSTTYVRKVLAQINAYDRYDPELITGPGGNWKGQRILQAALQWEGWPYSWGGGDENGPTYGGCCSPSGKSGAHIKGFDCSGLVIYALAQVGIRGVPHRATLQYQQAERLGGTHIPASRGVDALLPGDLVFFSTTSIFIPHVGIYAGADRMFNAAAPGTRLRHDPMRADYLGAVRFGDPDNGSEDAQLRGTTTASYFWDDGSGRNGDTGTPASGIPMRKGLAASPSWPLHTRGYVTYRNRRAEFVIGDRGPGEPSEHGVMLDLDARTFADLTGGIFNPRTLTVDGNQGRGHIQVTYTITQWGPGQGKRGPPQPFSTGAWRE